MSIPSTRHCQACKQEFIIEPDDFTFYEKIDVPPPTWCPECRMIRRMAWRNVRSLYKSPCKAPGHTESIISTYSPEKNIMVYDQSYWWSQQHDPLMHGKPYDFSVPFFVQFVELLRKTPLPNLSSLNSVDSEYVNMTMYLKSCYLVFSSTHSENCSYSEGINECRDSCDLLVARKSENCYWCIDCTSCFNVLFGTKVNSCNDSAFLFDCRNCSHCFGCWNLRNKQHCILNKQYSKEDYFKELQSFNLGSYGRLQEIRQMFSEKTAGAICRFADIFHSENVTGDRIESSHNCHYSFDIAENTDSKYVWRILEVGGSDNYDITVAGKPTLTYEGQGAGMGQGSKFVLGSGDTSFSQYAHSCISGCLYCFGCVGLTSKSYCILNKQYKKEEYETLVPKIIEHMNVMPYVDKRGRVYRYGEFFPIDLSPFAYNETIAQEYFPLTKEEALSRGLKWRDQDVKEYAPTTNSANLPDNIKDVKDNITTKVIQCADAGKCTTHQCTAVFRIIPQELEFYRKINIALPRFCSNCRHYERLAERNPMKLWHRKCMKPGCMNEFETSYAPDRKEIIYCESCYQAEII